MGTYGGLYVIISVRCPIKAPLNKCFLFCHGNLNTVSVSRYSEDSEDRGGSGGGREREREREGRTKQTDSERARVLERESSSELHTRTRTTYKNHARVAVSEACRSAVCSKTQHPLPLEYSWIEHPKT